MPIIEGVNADALHIQTAISFIKSMNIKKVNLLPYHDIAKHKYKKLDIVYEEEKMTKPTEEKMQYFKEMFESEGYEVKIGG
jgi:pyruvate formate lyase activating enzyme